MMMMNKIKLIGIDHRLGVHFQEEIEETNLNPEEDLEVYLDGEILWDTEEEELLKMNIEVEEAFKDTEEEESPKEDKEAEANFKDIEEEESPKEDSEVECMLK